MACHHTCPTVVIIILSLLITVCSAKQLLLISCDGFRHDYLTLYPKETSYFHELIFKGVFVPKVFTTYATFTFPSHWTIVTGNYQENHGIVSNRMYDPSFNETFQKSNHDEKWWNETLPIWISAKKQGLSSGTMFWPGSEVSFNGVRPDHFMLYNASYPYVDRVESVVEWLSNGTNFCTLYFEEPDTTGHSHGPDSSRIRQALNLVNFFLEYLLNLLDKKGLLDKVDIIITGDHGMTRVDKKNAISFNNTLEEYLLSYTKPVQGPQLGLFVKEGKTKDLIDKLKSLTTDKSSALQIFSRDQIPSHLHYKKHRRIPDVVVISNISYCFYLTESDLKYHKIGQHGFDPSHPNMQTMLIAIGPSFKQNKRISGLFKQVDIYGLMCRLLGLSPQKNDGDSSLYQEFLNEGCRNGGVSFSFVLLFLTLNGIFRIVFTDI